MENQEQKNEARIGGSELNAGLGAAFVGRKYCQVGYGSRTIRFADVDGGVATTTYSYSMTQDERSEMARRITAALNLLSGMTTEEIERATKAPTTS